MVNFEVGYPDQAEPCPIWLVKSAFTEDVVFHGWIRRRRCVKLLPERPTAGFDWNRSRFFHSL